MSIYFSFFYASRSFFYFSQLTLIFLFNFDGLVERTLKDFLELSFIPLNDSLFSHLYIPIKVTSYIKL